MKTIRIVLAAAALAAALASCSTGVAGSGSAGASDTAAASAGTAQPAPGGTAGPGAVTTTGDQAVVETVFRGYYQALLARDFPTACSLNAPETTAKLLENLKAQGATVGTCEEAFSTIYGIPGAAEAADGIAGTAVIQGITVTGDTASITWSAEVNGERPTVTNGLRRIDGQWRLLDTN